MILWFCDIPFSDSDFTLRLAVQFESEKKLSVRVLKPGTEVIGSIRKMYEMTNNMKKLNTNQQLLSSWRIWKLVGERELQNNWTETVIQKANGVMHCMEEWLWRPNLKKINNLILIEVLIKNNVIFHSEVSGKRFLGKELSFAPLVWHLPEMRWLECLLAWPIVSIFEVFFMRTWYLAFDEISCTSIHQWHKSYTWQA